MHKKCWLHKPTIAKLEDWICLVIFQRQHFKSTKDMLQITYLSRFIYVQIPLMTSFYRVQLAKSSLAKILIWTAMQFLTVTPAHPSVSLHFPSALIGSVPVLFGKITTTHLYLHIDMKTQSFYLSLLNYQHDSKKLWF